MFFASAYYTQRSTVLALEWWKFHTFEVEYLWSQLANLDQSLYVRSLGWGKGCIRFWGRFDQNSGFHGNRKPPLTYMGKMMSPSFLGCFDPNLFILAGNEDMHKSRTSSDFRQIGLLTMELAALEFWKISCRLIMGKWCLHASSFNFDWIIIKVAGNQDRTSSISGLWFPWPIYMFFWNEIWPCHIWLRWAIVALWATSTSFPE